MMNEKGVKTYFNGPPTMVLLGQMDKLIRIKEELEFKQFMVLAEKEKRKWQVELEKEWQEMLCQKREIARQEEKRWRQKKVLASIDCQLPELIDEKCKDRLLVFSKYD